MPNMPPYACGACSEMFDSYAAFDAHRSSVHGRRADGTLVGYDARPTLEQRIAALERRIAVLCAVIEQMKEGSEL